VTATEQAVVQAAEQAAAAMLLAAVLLAAAVVARRTAGRLSTTGRLATGYIGAAARFATLVAAAGRLASIATAVAPAVVQAKHAIQELEAEALAAQAYADY
jgi:hypothetical protein